MGSYVSVLNDTNQTIYIKYGPRDMITRAFVFVASLIPGILDLGIVPPQGITDMIMNAIDQEAKEEGLSKIGPGGRYDSEKLSLSLMIQANIVKGMLSSGSASPSFQS